MSAEVAVQAYYKLKGKYQAKQNRLKKRILKSDEPMDVKRMQFRALHRSMPCISCKKHVGTIFATYGKSLRAFCGADDNSCDLNININRGEYGYSPKLLQNIQHDIEVVKMDIIKEKLGLLFGLNDEAVMVEKFELLKTSYKDLNHYMNLIEKDMLKGQVVEIDEAGDSPRRISKLELAKINQIRLGNLIIQFQSLISEFSNDEVEQSKNAKLTDAIELYLQEILPVLEILRTALYDITTVIIENRQYRLIQIKIKLENLIMELEAPQIISNIK